MHGPSWLSSPNRQKNTSGPFGNPNPRREPSVFPGLQPHAGAGPVRRLGTHEHKAAAPDPSPTPTFPRGADAPPLYSWRRKPGWKVERAPPRRPSDRVPPRPSKRFPSSASSSSFTTPDQQLPPSPRPLRRPSAAAPSHPPRVVAPLGVAISI
jgi:hypothetical protein